MPKGKRGCWKCGGKTSHVLQLWLRDYVENAPDAPAGTQRGQRSVESVGRALCDTHAAEVAREGFALLERVYGGALGCGTCGVRTVSRVQLWLRTTAGDTVKSKTTSYCEPDTDAVYSALVTLLDPDATWRTQSRPHAGARVENLAKARARMRNRA